MKDEMRELDYFSDRFVLMRAVKKSNPEWKGRSIVEDIEPTIIEVLD